MEDDGGAGVLLGPVRGEPGGGGALETSSCDVPPAVTDGAVAVRDPLEDGVVDVLAQHLVLVPQLEDDVSDCPGQ